MSNKDFIFYEKDGIMKKVEIPEFGSVLLKSQDKKIVFVEVTRTEKV